ncbi:unnamed protein product [Tilletia controversa]|nr:unnamed protein product [Tilletia controversa]
MPREFTTFFHTQGSEARQKAVDVYTAHTELHLALVDSSLVLPGNDSFSHAILSPPKAGLAISPRYIPCRVRFDAKTTGDEAKAALLHTFSNIHTAYVVEAWELVRRRPNGLVFKHEIIFLVMVPVPPLGPRAPDAPPYTGMADPVSDHQRGGIPAFAFQIGTADVQIDFPFRPKHCWGCKGFSTAFHRTEMCINAHLSFPEAPEVLGPDPAVQTHQQPAPTPPVTSHTAGDHPSGSTNNPSAFNYASFVQGTPGPHPTLAISSSSMDPPPPIQSAPHSSTPTTANTRPSGSKPRGSKRPSSSGATPSPSLPRVASSGTAASSSSTGTHPPPPPISTPRSPAKKIPKGKKKATDGLIQTSLTFARPATSTTFSFTSSTVASSSAATLEPTTPTTTSTTAPSTPSTTSSKRSRIIR